MTLLFDLEYVVLKQGGDDITKSRMKGLAWGCLTCLVVLFFGLFTGVSMFSRPMNSFYILCHFLGVVLTGCLITQGWTVGMYVAVFLLLALLPALIELTLIVLALRTFRYR
eukprot:TRINITY_DN6120_c1_g1_i3.p3 TRINITY_DN6120_c1_g1~~TRINITY_DN6120_c1_g1_i3.p3  ORF type:complete len:111 (-),score=1.98 TRINITY_DN6120_c1_g1_i3:238-570(-)